MPTYRFTLTVDHIENFDELVDAVHEHCGDVEFQQRKGATWLDFTRDAPSFIAAVAVAIADATRAGLEVLRVQPTEGVSCPGFDSEETDRVNSHLATVVRA